MKKNMKPLHLHKMQPWSPSPANVVSPFSEESSNERPHRMRSILELYDDIEEITNLDFCVISLLTMN